MKTGLIYSIINKINKKRYVGLTTCDLGKRWKEHQQQAKNNPSSELHRSIAKYGVSMFMIRSIEDGIPIDLLEEREKHWIEQFDTFNNGYNQTTGGETSKTIREDVKNKISNTMTGVTKSDEHVTRISEGLKANKVTFSVSGDGKHQRQKIRAINYDTGEEYTFESQSECAEYFNAPKPAITRAVNKGWKFRGFVLTKTDKQSMSYAVIGIHKDTQKIIYRFESVRQAGRRLSQTGSSSGCSKSLKSEGLKTWKSCYWFPAFCPIEYQDR